MIFDVRERERERERERTRYIGASELCPKCRTAINDQLVPTCPSESGALLRALTVKPVPSTKGLH